jgi:ABC-type transport system involved in multi-copper enzyme maturation permease subunit
VIGAFAAEWLKLRRNVYVWLTVLLILVVLAGRDYALNWYLIGVAHPVVPPDSTLEELRRALHPIGLARMAAGNPSGVTGALEFIVGVLIVGTEYSWGTLRTVLTVGPGRLETFTAKALCLILVMGIATILRYLVAAACSVVFATLDHQAIVWPPVVEVATSLPAAWLIAVCYASFGACLAFIFRRSTMAYGFGLTYLFVIEDRVVSILGQSGGSLLSQVWKLFPGPNATALVDSFGAGLGGQPLLVDSERAALTLVAYTTVALFVSAALLLRRDVI